MRRPWFPFLSLLTIVFRRPGLCLLLVFGLALTASATAPLTAVSARPHDPNLNSIKLARAANFSPMVDGDVCGRYHAPELVYERPPVGISHPAQITLNFVVDLDGNVGSVFVLDMTDPKSAEHLLNAVAGWHYRPATCDGVPTQSQATVRITVASR